MDWGRTPSPADPRWGATPYPAHGRADQPGDQRWVPYRGHEQDWSADARGQEGNVWGRHFAPPPGEDYIEVGGL